MRNLRITIWTIAALLTASTATLGDVTEMDTFAHSWGQIDLVYPEGPVETIDLYGPSEIHVFFEGGVEGVANDDDGDGLDEVSAEIVAMNLTGTSSNGTVVLSLNPGLQSLGEIIETNNSTSGTLDVSPFRPGGTAESFFDVYFKLEFPGSILYNQTPAHDHPD